MADPGGSQGQAGGLPEGMTVADRQGYLEVTVDGPITLPRARSLLDAIFLLSAKRKTSRVLVEGRGVTGALSTLDRYEFGAHAARGVGIVDRMAIVAPASMIDPEKFGVRVARNRGFTVDVFGDLDKALRWLLESK